MKKLLMITLVIAFSKMSVTAQPPSKPVNFIAGIGLGIPSSPSEFSDFWKMGFHGMAGAEFNSRPNISLIGKIEYHSFAFDWDKFGLFGSGGALNVLLIGGGVKYILGEPNVPTKPFLLAGIGIGNISISEIPNSR